ncbi:hypothetical protein QK292_11275 [Arthrobacter sp. AL08]|uniref:hypothetical protein n=1 Tax=Micrococcaceae TaxID=1268 RepID=UPI00249A38BD|nr:MULTISPECIES: hypothetical protein [Micrococcaceae]MDI3242245.1 hypothetical protein [Arthrobacter sp. AL05]MDI3278150.1 hypothetical protein [Arthrobacter sp. AL08]MDJ0353162.1 hypothetical protein [Pseudarthrobacter sp. PH31-O2]
MTNPFLDQERANFIEARALLGRVHVPAWPRQSKELDLVELEADWVRFSTMNHRTRAEQLREIAKTGRSDLFTADPLGPTAQDAQYAILRGQEGFPELKQDLRDRGQQDPAITTADGVLINGNRRTAALRSLFTDDDVPGARYVKCLVLPADATPAELVDLETELQVARDFKQEYAWINEALLIEELYERENKDFGRVATRMHREIADVRSLYEKLQHVHQLVGLSKGARLHIDFNVNESAFDELAKHVKNKAPAEAESVRSVYFLGTLANVNYRKLRNLRRADAAQLVSRELESDPSLIQLIRTVGDSLPTTGADIFDDVLGEAPTPGPLNGLLSFLAQKRPEDTVTLEGAGSVAAQAILETVRSAITAAADEAEEDQRDQTAITAPVSRTEKAIAELQRALSALPKARSFVEFDENAMGLRIKQVRALVEEYEGSI